MLKKSGIQSSLLNLIHEASKTANITVKTPVGVSASKKIEEQVMQGETLSSILCTNSMDKISTECKIKPFKYREKIVVPKLGFVDDLFDIQKCKKFTKMVNIYTNEEISKRKLQLSRDKCKRMHIEPKSTKNVTSCDDLFIDNWSVIVKKREGQNSELVDVYNQQVVIQSVESMDYLGDIVSSDASHRLNIQARVSKGQGIITDIMQIMQGIFFGEYLFEAFILMRNSLFLSVITNNLEVSVISKKRCERFRISGLPTDKKSIANKCKTKHRFNDVRTRINISEIRFD